MTSKSFTQILKFTIKSNDIKEAFLKTIKCTDLYVEHKSLCDKFIKTVDWVKMLNSKKFSSHVTDYMNNECENFELYEGYCCESFFDSHDDIYNPLYKELELYVDKNKKPVKTVSAEYKIELTGTAQQLKDVLAYIENIQTVLKITKI